MKQITFYIILSMAIGLLTGCNNTNIDITGLKSHGLSQASTPGVDTGNPVASVTNGTFTVKGKLDTYVTSSTVNGSFIVTGEVIR